MVETIEFHGNILDIPNNKALRIHQWITKQINKRASSFCSFYLAFASGRQIRQVSNINKLVGNTNGGLFITMHGQNMNRLQMRYTDRQIPLLYFLFFLLFMCWRGGGGTTLYIRN